MNKTLPVDLTDGGTGETGKDGDLLRNRIRKKILFEMRKNFLLQRIIFSVVAFDIEMDIRMLTFDI